MGLFLSGITNVTLGSLLTVGAWLTKPYAVAQALISGLGKSTGTATDASAATTTTTTK